MAEINKIVVIDFDNTLFYTPFPEKGKKRYEAMTGEPYPHRGWWGRPESLDMDVMGIEPNDEIMEKYRECENDSKCMTVLCTGRLSKLSDAVGEILNRHNVYFDEENFNPGTNTLPYKIDTFERLHQTHPDAEMVIYDDRDEHIPYFKQWASDKEGVEVVHVK